jgi:ABC transport system ATP-binding/permease protein
MVNLISAESITKSYGKGNVLDGISIGVAEGARIGIVGRNGGGKSTLVRALALIESVDAGKVTHNSELRLGYLTQVDLKEPTQSVSQYIFGNQQTHDWAGNPIARDVIIGLFGSLEAPLLGRRMGELSGGELRRTSLAQLLISDINVILLDEPTNHLDIEGINWLAAHLKQRRNIAVIVITHDRWFLDEVADQVWEVIDGKVEEYEGGYSAFVLAKAERIRQSAAEDARRNNLIRKELAWLRRGAPARTTKPKFRVDAANELISKEPPPRNQVELLNFAANRLGNKVFELHNVDLVVGENKKLLDKVEMNFGPGIRYGILGPNGAGKTSLLKLLSGQLTAKAGKLQTGVTVKLGYLSQHLDELDPTLRVLEAVEQVAQHVDLGKGRELSASQLCERLGFGSDSQWTPVGDLSGGERRRLQLTRILMGGPNVIFLDEPTNDFDVETLAALEDLLDGFAGTVLVISHDRYFLERVCDQLYMLAGDGKLTHLPGGIEQYLSRGTQPAVVDNATKPKVNTWQLQKDLAKVERKLEKTANQLTELTIKMSSATNDFAQLTELQQEFEKIQAAQAVAEQEWERISESLESAN